MNEEAQLLASLWENIQEYVPTSEKVEVAETIIKTLMDHGNDFRLLHDAEGVCSYLDRALNAVEEEEAEGNLVFDEYEDE